jgi:dTDP-4-amino-4,6-dideoxygalactose transaminase
VGALEEADPINQKRLASWQRYHDLLQPLEAKGSLRRPIVPGDCRHNAHMYYVLLSPEFDRQPILDEFRRNDIGSVFHYVPLHSSPAGQRYARAHGDLAVTDAVSERLIRLPMWVGLTLAQQDKVVEVLNSALRLAR